MKYLLILLIFAGCTTVKKATDKLDSEPLEAAKYCAEKFPVKDTVIIKKDSVHYDTITQEFPVIDTLWKVYNDTVHEIVTKTLPAKTIVKTVIQTKEVVRENTARVKQLELSLIAADQNTTILENELQAKSEKIQELKKERNKWRLYFFILLFVSIGWQTKKLWLKFL